MVMIREFYNKPIDDASLPYDIVDDMAVFVRNDPMFYRKNFFPAIQKMKAKGSNFDPVKELGPMIDKASHNYCKKFNINKRPETLLNAEEKKVLINKLYSEEMTQIRNGVY
jgi:hypothetical protein